jgi:ElaB/YqjD/DUF883 family membrane-anchored ribosome-binding protein
MSSTFPPGQSDVNFESNATGVSGGDYVENESSRAADAYGGFSRSQSLRSELLNLQNDLNSLVSRASSLSESELNQAYVKLTSRFSSIRFRARGVAQQAGQQFNQGIDITTTYVKDRPLQSVAIATGVGLVLGMLAGRR